MDVSQVENEDAVHIEPKIIVTGELEDDVMSPIVQTACRLGEACLKLHAEEEVDGFAVGLQRVEQLVLARIAVGQLLAAVAVSVHAVDIAGVDAAERAGLDLVEGIELAVLDRPPVYYGIF